MKIDFIPSLFDPDRINDIDKFRVTSDEFTKYFIDATLAHKEVARRIAEEFADAAPHERPTETTLTTTGLGGATNNTFAGFVLDRHHVMQMLMRTTGAQGRAMRLEVVRYIKQLESRCRKQAEEIDRLRAKRVESAVEFSLLSAIGTDVLQDLDAATIMCTHLSQKRDADGKRLKKADLHDAMAYAVALVAALNGRFDPVHIASDTRRCATAALEVAFDKLYNP